MSLFDAIAAKFIFFPERELEFSPEQYDLEYTDLFFDTRDGVRLHGWLFPAGKDPAKEGLLIFFHGNAGNISHRLENIKRLVQHGIPVFIVDYRGYGKSDGVITESGFYEDAEAAVRHATGEMGVAGQRIVLFGRSLGGVAAVHAASVTAVAGVILEGTFNTLSDMARFAMPYLPAGLMVRGHMDSQKKIRRVLAPKLFIHGDMDEVVPLYLGKRLFEAALPPKEFYILKGAGHNDTYLVGGKEYFSKIAGFFRRVVKREG